MCKVYSTGAVTVVVNRGLDAGLLTKLNKLRAIVQMANELR
jgi:hypothetical protein